MSHFRAPRQEGAQKVGAHRAVIHSFGDFRGWILVRNAGERILDSALWCFQSARPLDVESVRRPVGAPCDAMNQVRTNAINFSHAKRHHEGQLIRIRTKEQRAKPLRRDIAALSSGNWKRGLRWFDFGRYLRSASCCRSAHARCSRQTTRPKSLQARKLKAHGLTTARACRSNRLRRRRRRPSLPRNLHCRTMSGQQNPLARARSEARRRRNRQAFLIFPGHRRAGQRART